MSVRSKAKPAVSATVAVIGTGPTGLSMLKTLREDGFDATAFERRSRVGGLWSYTEDKGMTSALPGTKANISKFTCGYSDFPMPDRYPVFMKQADFQDFTEEYAKRFGLYDHIVFNSDVKLIDRTSDGKRWNVKIIRDGREESRDFDKVVLCHGYQTVPKLPSYEGQSKFTGDFIHAQHFRDPETLRGKKVVIVGMGPTACEVAPMLTSYASKVYLSHRRGSWMLMRWNGGLPVDLMVNHSRRRTSYFLSSQFPNLYTKLTTLGLRWIMRRFGKLDPEWRISDETTPPVSLTLAHAFDDVLPYLKDGSLTSMHGIKQFLGDKTIEFADGQVIEDVDTVLCCTGYKADFRLTPWVEKSTPAADKAGNAYGGQPIARLYMNMFPPEHVDSIAILAYSAYGKNNGFSFSDVASMAISNIWRGVSDDMIPSKEEMERRIDEHHKWIAARWHQYDHTDVSAVKQWEFQGFLHDAAGTGLENLGWGWKGWLFFFKDPKMSWLMGHGAETAHAFRYFETGKRETWPGARDAIIHVNDLVKQLKESNNGGKKAALEE